MGSLWFVMDLMVHWTSNSMSRTEMFAPNVLSLGRNRF